MLPEANFIIIVHFLDNYFISPLQFSKAYLEYISSNSKIPLYVDITPIFIITWK